MLALFFLLTVISNGWLLSKNFLSDYKKNLLANSFILGSITSVSLITVLLFVTHEISHALWIYAGISVFFFLINHKSVGDIRETLDRKNLIHLAVFLLTFLVFEKSFSYDPHNKQFLIASNLYQDFGAHIPFMRYLTFGKNYIPEIPFFGGSGLTYHFMFDFYAGILEYLGLRLDYAINLISTLSFVSFASVMVTFGYRFFKSRAVGVVAIIFMILNSDLSIMNLIGKYGLSFASIYHNNTYPVGNILGLVINENFLNINVLLNQRHLIFALASLILICSSLFASKGKLNGIQTIFLGTIIGLMVFWHVSVSICIFILLFSFGLFFKDLRGVIVRVLLVALVVSAPQFYYIKLHSDNNIVFMPGFMIAKSLSAKNFILFWIWNLGFSIPVVIFGFLAGNNHQRKFFLCFLPIFIVANLFQFSKDMFDNHKFFNVWIVSLNMLAAYGVWSIFNRQNYRFVVIPLVLLLTVSGFLHLVVVKNDVYARITDYKFSSTFSWINKNTKSEEILLTNGEIYDPLSIAGAKIFLGRPRYIYLYGGDPGVRMFDESLVFSGTNKKAIFSVLKSSKIRYIVIYKTGFATNAQKVNTAFMNDNFLKIYENSESTVYKI